MERSDVQYAVADGHHIAFRGVVGNPNSDVEIVMISGAFIPIDSLADDPIANRLVEGLAALGRLVMFDVRGIGLSDAIVDWETPVVDQWVRDLTAVIDKAKCRRPTVFCWKGGRTAISYAIANSDRIDRLVLFNPIGPLLPDDRAWLKRLWESRAAVIRGEGNLRLMLPGRSDDREFRAWFDEAGRAGASPAQAARLYAAERSWVEPEWSKVTTPTLVITRHSPAWYAPADFFKRVPELLPNAVHVALPDGDMLPIGLGVDDILAEISQFLTGVVQVPAPERTLAAIMFTDLVESTSRASTVGDASWKKVLDRHDAICCSMVGRRGGSVVKSTGDGVLALLPSATAALDAAQAIRRELDGQGLAVRIGVHVGEIDRRGNDVSGLAVNIAARIMSEAQDGQILVSKVTTQFADNNAFESVGHRTLKGIQGNWPLYRAT